MRLEVMQRDDFACCGCGSRSRTLNVHHKHYIKGAMPWDYPARSLVTLCKDCHEEIEFLIPLLLQNVSTPNDAANLIRISSSATAQERSIGMLMELCPVVDYLAEAEICRDGGDREGMETCLLAAQNIIGYLHDWVNRCISNIGTPSLDFLIQNAPEQPAEENNQ